MNPTSTARCVLAAVIIQSMGCQSNHERQFFQAVENEDVAEVQRLVRENPKLVTAIDELGATGLDYAVLKGDAKLAKILIAAGSDMHHDSPRFGMPLHHAAYFGDEAIVEELLQAGVNVNLQPPSEDSHHRGTALHYAALGARPKIVAMLLEHGADVNARDRKGSTPLCRAVNPEPQRDDRQQVVELLLEHGADVSIATEGWTPLQWAQQFKELKNYRKQFEDIEATLIKHGAK